MTNQTPCTDCQKRYKGKATLLDTMPFCDDCQDLWDAEEAKRVEADRQQYPVSDAPYVESSIGLDIGRQARQQVSAQVLYGAVPREDTSGCHCSPSNGADCYICS